MNFPQKPSCYAKDTSAQPSGQNSMQMDCRYQCLSSLLYVFFVKVYVLFIYLIHAGDRMTENSREAIALHWDDEA